MVGISTQLRALETLGVASKGCASMLFPLIESCYARRIITSLATNSVSCIQHDNSMETGGSSSSSEIRLKNLMHFLKKEVESEQRITLASESFGLCTFNSRDLVAVKGKETKNTNMIPPTAAGLVNAEVRTVTKCIFCDNQHHDSVSCFKAPHFSLQKRRDILTAKKACFRCLNFGHQSRHCRVRIKCLICGKSHVTLMCPEPRANKTSKEEGPPHSTPPQNESSTNMMSCTNGTGSHVFLQTLKIIINGLNGFKVVRVLIDTGPRIHIF